MGSALAEELSNRGHSVAIIDQDSDAFRRLPEDFDGQRVTGVGFDRDALRQAGIEDAAGFAAVSSGDNSNVIAARVVRETFGVENVVARIYDPRRARVYSRLGIATVPTVSWTTDQVLRQLIPLPPAVDYHHAVTGIDVADMNYSPKWWGRNVSEMEDATGVRVAFLIRGSEGVIPSWDTVIQEGDGLHVIVHLDESASISRALLENESEEDE